MSEDCFRAVTEFGPGDFEICQKWLADAVAAGNPQEFLESVENRIALNDLTLWIAPFGIAVGSIDENCQTKVMTIHYIGGDVTEILKQGTGQLERCAQFLDCDFLVIQAPRMQSSQLKRRGYREAYTTFAKSIAKLEDQ